MNLVETIKRAYRPLQKTGVCSVSSPWFSRMSTTLPTDLRSSLDIIINADQPVGELPTISWSFKEDVELKAIKSASSVSSGVSRRGVQYKYRHDLVCGALTGEELYTTDCTLSTIMRLGDDWDMFTPDVIMDCERFWLVIEVSTVDSNVERELLARYKEKFSKYHEALLLRSQKSIQFVIIVVGVGVVCSSLKLSRAMVDDLCLRMVVGMSLENIFLEKTGRRMRLDEKSVRADDEKSQLKQAIIRSGRDCTIKKEDEKFTRILIDDAFAESCEKLEEGGVGDALDDLGKAVNLTLTEGTYQPPETRRAAYLSSLTGEADLRSDTKCVTNVPLVLPARSAKETSDIQYYSIMDDDEPAFVHVWKKAMDDYCYNRELTLEDPGRLLMEALETDQEVVTRRQEEAKIKRKLYRRVDIRALSDDDRIDLALQGVWAKSMKTNHAIIEKRERSQKGFHPDTPTTDISRFLTRTDLLASSGREACDEEIQLLAAANSLVENKEDAMDVVRVWAGTKLFESLNFLSCAMVEIAISNKQHCKPRQMIIKKIRQYEAYLLISPTRADQHAFVSFFFPASKSFEVLCQLPFLKVHRCSAGHMTDFVSFKVGKIENKASTHAALISLASYFSWFYGLADPKPRSFIKHPSQESLKMLLLSLLIRLEDKEYTEFVITQTRYMFMEVFKSNVSFKDPDPLKHLSKLNTIIRSRLALYLTRTIADSFYQMSVEVPTKVLKPRQDEDGLDLEPEARDEWRGLINPLTGGSLKTFTESINIAYLGYLKNKNDSAEGNVDYSLIKKILEQDLTLGKLSDEELRGDPIRGFPKPKGFKKIAVDLACSLMQKRMESIHGPNYKDTLGDLILRALQGRITEEIATLKASCTIDVTKIEDEKAIWSTKLGCGRIKVLEAVMLDIDQMGLNPFFSLDKLIDLVESHGGRIVCDIFKKLQHGGLREIFVLTLVSRVIQLYIETMSRVLCEQFIEETMTHPNSKMSRLDDHHVAVENLSRSMGSNCVHLCSSRDKSKWSQQMMMRLLYMILTRLTPQWMHGSIRRCLNMWIRKVIKMPQRVVNLLSSGIQLSDPVYQSLLECFNDGGDIVLGKCSPHLTIRTGMMQGILHYTSSLLHVAFLLYLCAVVLGYLATKWSDYRFKMTQVCSSDDSSSVLSVIGPPGVAKDDKRFREVVAESMLIHEQQYHLCKNFGMTDSPKSADNLINTIEFNSEFRTENTIVSPIIKYVAASLTIAESESLLKRMEGSYGLISQLFSSGMPAFNTSLCQLAQGLLHYRTMGSGISPLFPIYMKKLLMVPDPIYGFFLVDTRYFPGLMGLGYSHWLTSLNANLHRMTVKAFFHNDLEISEGGGVVRSLTIKMGDCKKWKSMVDRVKGSMDLNALIEEDPSILFRKAVNVDELKVKLLIRATSPGVARSMMGGNPFIQALAVSSYMLHTHCFTRSSLTEFVTGKLTTDREKTSLLLEMTNRISGLDNQAAWTVEDQRVMFPCVDRYIEARATAMDLNNYNEIGYHVLRNKKNIYYVQQTSMPTSISLKMWVKFLWFKNSIDQPMDSILRTGKYYHGSLSWLSETIQESLEKSPFSTYQELSGFIESFGAKSRKFMRYGPSAVSANFQMRLLITARRGFKKGVLLCPREMLNIKYRDYQLASNVSLALSIPDKERREQLVLEALKVGKPLVTELSGIKSLGVRDQKLALIQMLATGSSYSDGALMNLIRSTPAGIIYTFLKPQVREKDSSGKWRWRGPGTVMLLTANVSMLVDMLDNKCRGIRVSCLEPLVKYPKIISNVLRTLDLKNEPAEVDWRSNMVFRDGIVMKPGDRRGERGIPVYLDSDLRRIDAPDGKLVLRVEEGKIVVKQIIDDSTLNLHKEMTVLSWHQQSYDVQIQPDVKGHSEDIYDSWVLQQKHPVSLLLRFISHCVNLPEGDSKRAWLKSVISSRMSARCGVDARLISGIMDPETLLRESTEQVTPFTKEEMQALTDRAFNEVLASAISGCVERMGESDEFKERDGGELYDLGVTEDYSIKDNKVIGDFKRRMVLVDELIDFGNELSPGYWANVLDGVKPSASPRTAQLVMSLLHIAPKKVQQSLDDLLIPETSSNQGQSITRQKSNSFDEDAHSKVRSVLSAGEEPSESDDESLLSEDLEREFEAQMDLMGLGSSEDDIKQKQEALKVQEVLDKLHSIELMAGLDDDAASLLATYQVIAKELDTALFYTVVPNCRNHGIPKIRSVLGDGNCYFRALLFQLGHDDRDMTLINKLKMRLLRSKYLAFCQDQTAVVDILTANAKWAEIDTVILSAREFGLNICVHYWNEGLKEGVVYCEIKTGANNPWIHLKCFSNHYEPIIFDDEPQLRVGLEAESAPKGLAPLLVTMAEQRSTQIQKKAIEEVLRKERKRALSSLYISRALAERSRSPVRRPAKCSAAILSARAAWESRYERSAKEHNMFLDFLTRTGSVGAVTSPAHLPTLVSKAPAVKEEDLDEDYMTALGPLTHMTSLSSELWPSLPTIYGSAEDIGRDNEGYDGD